jgi:hypothetical protein
MGAASASICRPLAATWARSVWRAATDRRARLPRALIHEAATGPALPLHDGHGSPGPPPPGRLSDRAINLGNAGINVGDGVGRHLDPGGQRRALRFDTGSDSTALAHMGGDKLSVESGPRRPSRVKATGRQLKYTGRATAQSQRQSVTRLRRHDNRFAMAAYSITSSTSASTLAGTLSPIVLAVLRLRTRS